MNNESRIVFITEDKESIPFFLKSFEDSGFTGEIATSSTLAQGLNLCRMKATEAVFMDWALPDGLALDFLKGVTRDAENKVLSFPVLLMIQPDQETLAFDALERGVFDYIFKSSETFINLPRIFHRILKEWKRFENLQKSEKELIEKEQLLRCFFNSSFGFIGLLTPEGKMKSIRRKFYV